MRDPAHFEPSCVKIGQRVSSLRVPREKIKSKESDISPIGTDVSHGRIFTKLGTNVSSMDVINYDKFYDNLLKGLNFTGGQNSKFSRRKLTLPL